MLTRKDIEGEAYRFDSLRAVGEYVRDTKKTWRARESTSAEALQDWDLGAGYEGAVRMAVEGWDAGAKRAQRALATLAPLTSRPRQVISMAGSRPHVALYCAGSPAHMIRRATDGTGTRKVMTLIVPVNANGFVSAPSMANLGVAIAQYVRQLEAQGTRVELLGAICSEVSGARVSHVWTVKRADQPLNLAVVAFSIGHPAMFRRIGFALRERCGVKEDPCYGRSQPLKASDVINCPLGAIILNGMTEADTVAPTAEAGLEYVERTIQAALGKR